MMVDCNEAIASAKTVCPIAEVLNTFDLGSIFCFRFLARLVSKD
jgi:hypothetical protein